MPGGPNSPPTRLPATATGVARMVAPSPTFDKPNLSLLEPKEVAKAA